MDSSLSFLPIHALAYKLSTGSVFSRSEKCQFALDSLNIMDLQQALHPTYTYIYKCLLESCDDNLLPKEYDSSWSAAIRDKQIASQIEGDTSKAEPQDKQAILALFIPKFQQLFVQAEFQDLIYSVNRVGLLVEFKAYCTDHDQLIENRYFEFLFYHLVAIVYGQYWFSNYSVLEEAVILTNGSTGTKSWQQLEKSAWTYYNKTQFLFKTVADKRTEVVEGVNKEFDYFLLIRWLCTFVRFKENLFVAFVKDFEGLLEHFDLLDKISMRKEATLMYEIATVATKSFCDLVSYESESLSDIYAGSTLVEQKVYSLLCKLAEADFVGAKEAFGLQFTELLDAHISYALPRKLAGTFWKYLSVIVDLKVFLLVMSCALVIPRKKMLDKMGYATSTEAQKQEVSTKLIMMMSGLSLGHQNITFDHEKDVFLKGPISDEVKKSHLMEELDDLDHTLEAESVAQLIKTRLVERIFSSG